MPLLGCCHNKQSGNTPLVQQLIQLNTHMNFLKTWDLYLFFSGYTYTTFTKTDGYGNTTTIYDINTFQIAKSIFILSGVVMVACTVPIIIVHSVRKYRTSNQSVYDN